MKHSGQFADYRGTEYPVVVVAGETLLLAVPEGSDVLPDELERGSRRGTPWVRVPTAAVSRLFRRSVRAVWDGEEVSVMSVQGDRAGVRFLGDPAFAAGHGLTGSQHDGWSGWAPLAALSAVDEDIKELDS